MGELIEKKEIFIKKNYKEHSLECHHKSLRTIFIMKNIDNGKVKQSIIEHEDETSAALVRRDFNFDTLDGMYYLMTGKNELGMIEEAMKLRNKMNLEEKFYKTIKSNSVLVGDTVDNHPNRLTGSEIEKIYKYTNNK